jgi:hypothetical protein
MRVIGIAHRGFRARRDCVLHLPSPDWVLRSCAVLAEQRLRKFTASLRWLGQIFVLPAPFSAPAYFCNRGRLVGVQARLQISCDVDRVYGCADWRVAPERSLARSTGTTADQRPTAQAA